MKHRVWTQKEIDYLKARRLDFRQDIAKALNRTQGAVERKMYDLNLTLSPEETVKRQRLNQERSRQKIQEKKEAEGTKKKNPYAGISLLAGVYFAVLNNRSRRSKGNPRRHDLNKILCDVAEALDVSATDILGERQFREIVFARQIFCYVAKEIHPSKSLQTIAEFVGYKQHSMVIRAIDNIKIFILTKDAKFLSVWYKYLQNTKIYKVHATQN